MPELLLALALLFQLNPGPVGMVTGQVKSPAGTPASGVRVFAIPAPTSDAASTQINASVYESLVQTDAMGRYRLPVPPGRYYIAVGSVSSPTYFPDTNIVSSAKAIVVSANATLENIDFSRYVLAASNAGALIGAPPLPVLPPGSTGVLAGVIHLPDGSLAAGVPVVLAAASIVNSLESGNSASIRPALLLSSPLTSAAVTSARARGLPLLIRTDSSGRFRFDSITPDTYIVMAGYSDDAVYYPGTNDVHMAATIVTTPTTNLDNLNFTLPATSGIHTSVQGRILTSESKPAVGLQVTLILHGNPAGAAALLPARASRSVRTEGDGTYRFDDVPPGTYEVRTQLNGALFASKATNIAVYDQPVTANFEFRVNVVSGKIVWDDGTPFQDSAVSQLAVSTMDNPNFIQTILLPVSRDGAFGKSLEAGDYRFFIRDLPEKYKVASVTAGSVNLADQPLSFSGIVPVDVEIRIAKKTGNSPRVTGKVVDGSGRPSNVNRIVLCCLNSGPIERISAEVHSDGTFEFAEVPIGRYNAELLNQSRLIAVGPVIEVGTSDLPNLNVVSAGGTGAVGVTVKVAAADGAELPPGVEVTVTWISRSGGLLVKTQGTIAGSPGNLPSTAQYYLSISGIPEGFKIKSVSANGSELLAAPADFQNILTGPASIVILLSRESR